MSKLYPTDCGYEVVNHETGEEVTVPTILEAKKLARQQAKELTTDESISIFSTVHRNAYYSPRCYFRFWKENGKVVTE